MNKKDRYKISLKPKAPFKWVFMDIVPSTAPKFLTSDTTFSNYLLIFNAYSKIQNIYGMEKITTEEVMEKLDMFQSRFGELTNLDGGIKKESQQMQVRSLPRRSSKNNAKLAEFI